ncbi:hypothetical protein [Owenweeksia hongkongensis]|uniref:hypothetical protein n=1 Tax=Owenweeksia hongkongensis TaxID=253245 RepID=UPI003A8EBDBD
MVRLRAFRATEDAESSKKFLEGHTRVLSSVGVTKVTSNKDEWMSRDSVFVLVVEDMEGSEVLGGARINVYDGINPLPIEEATGYMDEKVSPYIKEFGKQGTGEICGLWNSRKVAGMGFGSVFLTRAAVSLTTQIGLNSLFALCAPYTVSTAARFGYHIVKDMGNEGTFYYPKLDLLATFMLLANTNTLEGARKLEQDKIADMRADPKLVVTERTKIAPVDIHYDLQLKINNLEEFHIY